MKKRILKKIWLDFWILIKVIKSLEISTKNFHFNPLKSFSQMSIKKFRPKIPHKDFSFLKIAHFCVKVCVWELNVHLCHYNETKVLIYSTRPFSIPIFLIIILMFKWAWRNIQINGSCKIYVQFSSLFPSLYSLMWLFLLPFSSLYL